MVSINVRSIMFAPIPIVSFPSMLTCGSQIISHTHTHTGVSCVISSLCEMDDTTAGEFMVHFYSELLRDLDNTTPLFTNTSSPPRTPPLDITPTSSTPSRFPHSTPITSERIARITPVIDPSPMAFSSEAEIANDSDRCTTMESILPCDTFGALQIAMLKQMQRTSHNTGDNRCDMTDDSPTWDVHPREGMCGKHSEQKDSSENVNDFVPPDRKLNGVCYVARGLAVDIYGPII